MLTTQMETKKFVIQVLAAIILYVVISMILERDYTADIFLRELMEGMIFGAFYAIFLWVRDRFRGRDKS